MKQPCKDKTWQGWEQIYGYARRLYLTKIAVFKIKLFMSVKSQTLDTYRELVKLGKFA